MTALKDDPAAQALIRAARELNIKANLIGDHPGGEYLAKPWLEAADLVRALIDTDPEPIDSPPLPLVPIFTHSHGTAYTRTELLDDTGADNYHRLLAYFEVHELQSVRHALAEYRKGMR